jgi:uncharacterized repeat protein (TIGR02543 family)
MFGKDTPPIVPPTPTTYTVTFNSQGGSAVSAQTVTPGGIATEPTPTRSGYTFGGWYTASTDGSKYNFSSAVTGNITLYARWSDTADDTADFGGSPDEIFVAGSFPEMIDAIFAIQGGGNDKDYVINVNSDFDGEIGGSNFGDASVTGIRVSIRGSGEIHKTAGVDGNVLPVNYGKTVILRGPTIRGWSGQTVPLVTVQNGGTFIMESGLITGGAGSYGAVYVAGGANFIMNGGSITGNNSDGVQVIYNGIFTMNGGSITVNDVGVKVAGVFNIYGSLNDHLTMVAGNMLNDVVTSGLGTVGGNTGAPSVGW